ncbi:MAG: RNA methyltransferase [Muribaculaceae bacterium]|nr:RNA methyltransferase [Muribaculaceae bacterium]
MTEKFDMVAKTFLGLEGVLADELRALGAENVTEGNRVVAFKGDKEMLYRANFACRTAVRVLKPFFTLRSTGADDLYEQLKSFDWEQLMTVKTTFAIDATVYSEDFNNSRFVTYRVKDAIADFFNEKYGKRPSIRLTNPDIRFDIHISGRDVTLSLDSSGDPLFKRGWRTAQTDAPINEVLAAGIIMLSGWKGDTDLVDPMCGSGTFLIEAALIGANIAPGVYRDSYAFQQWPDYDADLFDKIYNDDSGEREFNHKIYGSDIEGKAIAIARANVKNAGLNKYIELERRDLNDIEQVPENGTLISNPPYGERLNIEEIDQFYHDLGSKLKHTFRGYNVWLICYNKEQYFKIGLKPSVKYALNNGGLDCELLQYVIFDGTYDDMRERGEHIRNEDFRASERSKGNYNKVGSDERPRRREDGERRGGRRFDDDRRERGGGGRARRDERPPRLFDDRPKREEGPISDEERMRRDRVARDRRMMSKVDNRDKEGRYDNDFDQEFRHSATFAKRILRDRKPTLSADKEVPIIHGRRKSWKRRDLDESTDNTPKDNE